MDKKPFDGNIPLLSVTAESVPEAFYKAMRKVYYEGADLRTEYDRKDKEGNFIDPPGKDAKVSIEVKHPFSEPRFAPVSYCERGKYIAEILGAKDHLVLPFDKLMQLVYGEVKIESEATEWPYAYHQRLFSYPLSDGTILNQAEEVLDRLAKSPITRRAVIQTGVPNIDVYLKEDLPCLREICLRGIEDDEGRLVLGMVVTWRSRDLFKAWADNVIGITNLQRFFVDRLKEKTGREVILGNYIEFNYSLHIYGQDRSEKGADKFFENFPDHETYKKRCWTSEKARDSLIIPQLEELLTEETWRFGDEQKKIIQDLIDKFKSGKVLP